jgi:hypothetical protein
MKLKELEKVIAETPLFVPLFRVTKVPYWAQEFVKKGDYVVYYNGGFKTKANKGLHLGASYVEFLDYMTYQQFMAFTVADIAAFYPTKAVSL